MPCGGVFWCAAVPEAQVFRAGVCWVCHNTVSSLNLPLSHVATPTNIIRDYCYPSRCSHTSFPNFFFVNVRYGHVAAFTWRITSPSCLLHHHTQVKTVRRTDYCVSSQYLMSSFSYMYIFFPWATDLYEYTCRMWRQTRLAAGTGYVDAHALPLSAALAWVSYPCYQYMLKKIYSRI